MASATSPTTRRVAVVVVCLMVAVAAFVIGRSTAAGTDGADEEPTPAAEPDASVERQPGPSEIQGGVPVGFARTRAGAVAAAASYVSLFDGPTLLDDQRRAAALNVAVASDQRAALDEQLGQGAELLTSRLNLVASDLEGDDGLFRSVPAGWRITDYGEEAATVDVWGVGLLVVAGRGPLPAGWATTTVSLVWEQDDWRLSGFETAQGPAPPEGEQVADPSLLAEMAGFEPFVHAPPPEETA